MFEHAKMRIERENEYSRKESRAINEEKENKNFT